MLLRLASWIFASLLAWAPVSLQAMPFFVSGDSGMRGDSVEVGLFDELTIDFEAATIEVRFNPSHLAFISARLGGLIADPNQCDPAQGPATGFCLVLNDTDQGNGRLVASLASSLLPIDGAVDLELLAISFDILASAPLGGTLVSFECPNPAACSDYDIPLTTGAVTVLDSSTPIPLPSSAWLLALGLAIIPAVRMRS